VDWGWLTGTGYTAAGLISLAERAPTLLSENYWTDIAVPDGEVVRILGIMAGLFIILFAYWFFFIIGGPLSSPMPALPWPPYRLPRYSRVML